MEAALTLRIEARTISPIATMLRMRRREIGTGCMRIGSEFMVGEDEASIDCRTWVSVARA